METVRFLRDVDDEKKYGQTLEMAYVDAFNAVTDIGNRMYRDSQKIRKERACEDHEERHKELRHVLFVMGLTIHDMADRRKRLADVARGLSDVVFDEETPESKLRPGRYRRNRRADPSVGRNADHSAGEDLTGNE